MIKLLVIIGVLISGFSYGLSQAVAGEGDIDSIYAKLYGSCTKDSCPPGSFVAVTAKEGDTSTAMSDSGEGYDLLELKKIKFTVLTGDTDRPSIARLQAPGGAIYYIQWIFLKKV